MAGKGVDGGLPTIQSRGKTTPTNTTTSKSQTQGCETLGKGLSQTDVPSKGHGWEHSPGPTDRVGGENLELFPNAIALGAQAPQFSLAS